jgi:amino acid transporter/nucleotide-binding universal stress UspA family protein
MDIEENGRDKPEALSMLASERPRNVNWFQAGALLFGDWGTSRLYVLGLAFLVAGRSAFWLILAMSALILAVGWAYTQICRIFQNGGGVYTAGKMRHPLLGVIGALLLFADYTVTASLSAVEAFHYFGLGNHEAAQVTKGDPGDHIDVPHGNKLGPQESLWSWRSPGLWAIVAIGVIGALNLLGPKHTAAYAIFAALGMMLITLLVVGFALPQIDWGSIHWGHLAHPPGELWHGFVYIVLALSGVEAIANLTGVMKRPVYATARKSIWVVAGEVAFVNVLLAIVMVSLATPQNPQLDRHGHTEDMLAYLAHVYVGNWGEWLVRIVGGLLLLSAANTAVNGLMSVVYVMSRDSELPAVFQKLNGFGAPWVAAILAASVPAVVLLFAHDLHTLASLYAIGVVGAVAIDTTLCTFHPRLRPWTPFAEQRSRVRISRRIPMGALALLLIVIWFTLATTKMPALIFVSVVLAVGLILRKATRFHQQRRPKPSLLRQAIMEQLSPDAMARPKILLATAGSDDLAEPALEVAKRENAALVVSFVRDVALNYRVNAENVLTLENDRAAQELFTDFLEHGHREGVPIIPMYDTGNDAAVLLAEGAAINGVSKVLIGSSRRGALHNLIKGSFQKRLESLLPPDVPVEVISAPLPPKVEAIA